MLHVGSQKIMLCFDPRVPLPTPNSNQQDPTYDVFRNSLQLYSVFSLEPVTSGSTDYSCSVVSFTSIVFTITHDSTAVPCFFEVRSYRTSIIYVIVYRVPWYTRTRTDRLYLVDRRGCQDLVLRLASMGEGEAVRHASRISRLHKSVLARIRVPDMLQSDRDHSKCKRGTRV